MKTEWQERPLRELVVLSSGGTPSKSNRDYWGGDRPWVSAKDMKYFYISDSVDHLSEEGWKTAKAKAGPGTTLILARGMTLVKDVPICVTTVETAFNQDLKAVTPKGSRIEPEFVPYLLLGNKNRIFSLVDLAGHGTGRLATDPLMDLLVRIPPRDDRRWITDFLKSLDDKIELNRRMNRTLEAMAQAVFKSWFVDFEPVKVKAAAKAGGASPEAIERAAMLAISGKTEAEIGQLPEPQQQSLAQTATLFPDSFQGSELGQVPKGWRSVSFDTLATLDTTLVKPFEQPKKLWEHYSIPSFDDSRLPALERGSEIKSSKYLIKPSSVLSSKLNPRFPRTWWPFNFHPSAAICSTEFMQFVPVDSAEQAFIYGMIASDPFQEGIRSRVTGSTGSRQRAQPKQVAAMDVVDPGKHLRLKFVEITNPLFAKVLANLAQARTLTQLRDTVLPMLLSGKLQHTC